MILDSINSPVLSDSFWCFDAADQDFCLAPLNILEEITAPTFTVKIGTFSFDVPASWHILIYDPDTMQIDTISLQTAAGKEFTAFIYGPQINHHSGNAITVTDYKHISKNVAPLMNKHQMMCHPVSPNQWVCISPHDVQKHLKYVFVGNLLSF